MSTINNPHTGKTCPFCQFPIKQDSELVLCPACKVPHHRECWEQNKRCTTFGCQEVNYSNLVEDNLDISIIELSFREAPTTSGRRINRLLAAVVFLALIVLIVIFFSYVGLFREKPGEITGQPGTLSDNSPGLVAPEPVAAEHYGVTMVTVGNPNTIYNIPTGRDDSGTAQVAGGYEIAKTPVTYELWYEVRQWAEANGYYYEHKGREGSAGDTGQAPSASREEPVTNVSARDCMVWLNALSIKQGLEPVYRTHDGQVIRDARESNASEIDNAVHTDNNGYRLPTDREWEMAARWTNESTGNDGLVERGGRWWTPSNHASGATDGYENVTATAKVGWSSDNSDTGQGKKTQPVGQRVPNALGLYDMSGNVWEHCFILIEGSNRPARKVSRGGSWDNPPRVLQVGIRSDSNIYSANDAIGFRIARTP